MGRFTKRIVKSKSSDAVPLSVWESPSGVRVISYDIETVRAFCRGMASVPVSCKDDKFAKMMTQVFALLQQDDPGNRETIRKAIGMGREEMLRAGEQPVMVELLAEEPPDGSEGE